MERRKSNIGRILELCMEFKVQLFILAVLLVSNSIFSTYPIKYIEKIVDIATGDNISIKLFFSAGAVYLGLQIMNIVVRAAFEYMVTFIETKIGHSIRVKIFDKLQKLTFGFYDKNSSGDLMIRLVQDSNITIEGILKPFMFIGRDLITFILGVYFMGSIDLNITIIMIPIGVVLSFLAVKTGSKINKYSTEERKNSSLLWGKFTDGIRGIREIKANNQEEQFKSEVSEKSLNVNKSLLKMKRYMIVTENINSSFFMTIIAFIMIYGGYRVSINQLSIGGLTAIMMYNGLLVDPMTNFFTLYQDMQRIKVSIDKIFYVFDEEEEKSDCSKADFQYKSSIEVKDVSFKYEERQILNNVSMIMEKGERIGLVGYSGSGKSTISKLFMRFYDFEDGDILVDGQPIENFRLEAVRDSIAMVFQDTFLFSASLRENLKFSKPSATDEELQLAIKNSCLGTVIENLEFGLDTIIGENGAKLSGGERQRIAIARTILRNPEVLILDESTSALDPVTSSKIIENILYLYKNKTIIFVAHKLTAISGICDKIFVFSDGEIIEQGNHDFLMSNEMLYKEIYDSQFIEAE